MRLVADTGPLLHLHEADALQFLPLSGEVSVTPLILAELRMNTPLPWTATPPDWVKVHQLSSEMQRQASAWQHAGLLHAGESEALALAQALKPDWFLTDDAAARLLAESLGMETHGSLGIVLWLAAKSRFNPRKPQPCLTAWKNLRFGSRQKSAPKRA